MEIDLPPWKIFTKAISLIWEKRLFALHISLPIILLYALGGAALDLELIDRSSFDLPGAQPLEDLPSEKLAWGGAGALLNLFLFSVMAVYWHRSILLSERSPGIIPLRFDGVVWRYILYAVATVILTLLLGLLVGLFAALIGGGVVWISAVAGLPIAPRHVFMPVLVLLFLYLGIAFFRLSLVLPTAAIGLREFGFRSAWLISRGYGWRILAIVLLTFALSILIALLLAGIVLFLGPEVPAIYSDLPKSLTFAGQALFSVAKALITVGALSLTFAYLTYAGPEHARPRENG